MFHSIFSYSVRYGHLIIILLINKYENIIPICIGLDGVLGAHEYVFHQDKH